MKNQRLAGLLCVVALVVACSGSSDASKDSLSVASGGNTDTTIIIGPDGSSSVVEVPSDGTTPSGQTAPDDGNGGATPEPIDPGGPVGSFAPMVLQASRSDLVEIDVRQQSGASPQQGSIDHVVSVLQQVTGKNLGTSLQAGIDGGAQSWSADDLRALGAAGIAQAPGRTVLHLLFVHGSFGGDDSVLGVSVQGDTAAIFVDQVRATATPLVGSAGIEAAVVMHEVGHLMGLVDLFLHTGRQDPDHPGHSQDKQSVMYWAVESNIVTQLLQGGPPKDFDSADLADLATIRNSG